jgi:hypothetical protein
VRSAGASLDSVASANDGLDVGWDKLAQPSVLRSSVRGGGWGSLRRSIADGTNCIAISIQVEKRTDPSGNVVALLLLAGAGALIYRIVAVDWSGLWWFLAATLALIGGVGPVSGPRAPGA